VRDPFLWKHVLATGEKGSPAGFSVVSPRAGVRLTEVMILPFPTRTGKREKSGAALWEDRAPRRKYLPNADLFSHRFVGVSACLFPIRIPAKRNPLGFGKGASKLNPPGFPGCGSFSQQQDNSADSNHCSKNGAKDLLPTDDTRLRAEADHIRQQRDQDEQYAGDGHRDAEVSF
jgi:hypothetical protein